MNDFMEVKILHANGDLFRPGNYSRSGDDLGTFLDDLIKRTVWAKLHYDAKNWRLCTYSPEAEIMNICSKFLQAVTEYLLKLNYILMIEFS